MDGIKLNVKALASMMNLSIKELAEKAGIEYNHLRLISTGDVKMLGVDLMKLHDATGVPPENIKYD